MANPEPDASNVAKPGAGLMKLGLNLIGYCVLCLAAGGLVVTVFFPGMKGKGIPPALLFFLIPVWSLGAIGLLLLSIGWIWSKIAWLAPVNDDDRPYRPD